MQLSEAKETDLKRERRKGGTFAENVGKKKMRCHDQKEIEIEIC